MHGALKCVMHVLSGEWNWVFVCNTYLGGVTLTDVLLHQLNGDVKRLATRSVACMAHGSLCVCYS